MDKDLTGFHSKSSEKCDLGTPVVRNISNPFGKETVANQHPWRLSREECLLSILKGKNMQNFADIGVNDMFYTKKLKSFYAEKIYGIDVFFPEESVVKDGIICLNKVEKIPENELDCAVMMDVLEHIEDDVSFFKTVIGKVKSDGIFLITVPAYQFLFSAHDVKNLHFRRYNRKQLLKILKQEGITVERCHYFYTSLFIMRLLFTLRKKEFSGNSSDKWKYPEKHILTVILKTILNLDFTVNKILDKFFIRLPGLSLFAICRKK